MKRSSNLSLAQKLRAIVIGVSGCLLIASSLMFTLYTTYDAYRMSERYLESMARVVANNATAAISFADVDGATEVLNALRAEPDVTGGLLLDAQGEIFARYGETAQIEEHRLAAVSGSIDPDWQRIVLAEPIIENSTALGHVLLEFRLDNLYQQLLRNVLVTGAMLIGIMIVAVPLARRLTRSVAEPIESLKSTMAAVSDREDFSVRAAKANNDEVGFLIDQFNAMLDQLADRDAKLGEHRKDLERKVSERTRSLRVANKKLHTSVEDLQRAKEVAERASAAKGEFLANMSHEIRSPLNGVIGMAELLRKSSLNDRQLHFCRTILESSKSLLMVLNDILDFSKVEAGNLELENIEFNVVELVEATVQLFAEGAANKRLELICHLDLSEELIVRSDPHRLRQIMNNLISNAIKFTDQGTVSVKLMELEGTSNSARLRLSVTDSGIGMSEEAMQRVFDSFVQADGSTSRRYGGTGLGLTISRHLAELLGGSLQVTSAAGNGSEFWLEAEFAVVSRRTIRSGFDWRGQHALVVDDNPHHLGVLAAQLNNWGLSCERATTTEQVFARFRDGPGPQLLLVDEEIADNFGLTLLDQLRNAGLADGVSKVLMVSVTSLSDDLLAVSDNLDHVLAKPIGPSDLFNCVNELLSEPGASSGVVANEPVVSSQHKFSGFQVLVAEDNLVNQEVAEELLLDFGLEVAVVGDGQQALDYLKDQGVDIVFMDCQMPVLDGYAATGEIRKFEEQSSRERTPIVALTANALKGDREKCEHAGMDDFLSKPFEPKDLEAVLAKWLTPAPAATNAPARESTVNRGAPVVLESGALEQMRQMVARKPGFKNRLIESLSKESSELSEALSRGMPQTDAAWEQIRFLAHRLKSAAATVGAKGLASCLGELEAAAAQRSAQDFPSHKTRYEESIAATLHAVQAAFEDQPQQVSESTAEHSPTLAEVLLAEDDEPTRLLISESLRQTGYRVRCVEDGQAALDELQLAVPDILLLDMLMPRRDGFQVLHKLRSTAAGRHVPVIVMTGLDDGESIHRAFEAGATDFIVKPVAIEVLINRLRYILRTQDIAGDLRRHQRRLRRAQDTAGVSFWEYNAATDSFLLGEAVVRYLGLDPEQEQYTAEKLRGLVDGRIGKLIDVLLSMDTVTQSISELTLPARDGRPIRVRQHLEEIADIDTGERKFVGTVQDISKLRNAEQQVYELSHFDEVTGLPNEAFFRRSLQLLLNINSRKRDAGQIAFLLIDVAQQQRLASVLGDRQRSAFAKCIAQRLEEYTRASDLCCALPDPDAKRDQEANSVAALGPHRFAILLTEIGSNRDVATVCQRIIAVLSQPVAIDDDELFPNPAVGIAMAPEDGDDYEVLHRHALAALTDQLEKQSAGFQWYSHDQDQAVRKRLSLERDLRRAVERGEIEVFYQPRIDARTLQPCALEALARWRRNGELVSPVEFIPIAEETGAINEIGEFVLLEALQALGDWQARLFPQLRISVNVSGQQFKTSNLPSIFERALKTTGVDPQGVEIEITEGVLLDSTEAMVQDLNAIRARGIGLALDDFGTGYSSLSYLSRLPLDILKIDRSFVANVLDQRRSQAIIRASVSLANDLGLTVVAEGVETADQLDWLKDEGCDELQGFFFARPMPKDECEAWLIQRLAGHDRSVAQTEPRKPIH